jgi:hypothetical protein
VARILPPPAVNSRRAIKPALKEKGMGVSGDATPGLINFRGQKYFTKICSFIIRFVLTVKPIQKITPPTLIETLNRKKIQKNVEKIEKAGCSVPFHPDNLLLNSCKGLRVRVRRWKPLRFYTSPRIILAMV